MNAEVRLLANQVLNKRYLGIEEAMERIIGKYTEQNADVHAAVFNEIQDILNPHGTGEDEVYCES